MEKKFLAVLFLLLFCVSFVFADYVDTVSEDDIDENEETEEETGEDDEDVEENKPVERTGEAEMVYTTNFYIAIGLGVFAVLLVLYIVFIFLRGPTERWGPRVDNSAEVQQGGLKLPVKKKIAVREVGRGQNPVR